MLTYGIPESMLGILHAGMRVEVSLGKNKLYAGIVAGLHHERPVGFQVQPIKNIVDTEPVLSALQLRFWEWIAAYYMAPPGAVMQAALPAHLKLTGETRLLWKGEDNIQHEWSDDTYQAAEALEMHRQLTFSELRSIVGQRKMHEVIYELLEKNAVTIHEALETGYRPKKEKIIRLAASYKEEKSLRELFIELEKAPRQLNLVMTWITLSRGGDHVRQHELLEQSGGTAAQIKALTDKGVFLVLERDIDRLIFQEEHTIQTISLTPVQEQAYRELQTALKTKQVTLLEGVTGSGKTLLYVHKIKECIAAGRQAVLLLPEIGLTTQLVSRLHAYFGAELGVYHSRFSNNERIEIWEKVKRQQYKVIAGPRSALWLPYATLGCIIVDEEQDMSYKQKDPAPRFHARDAAVYLASLHGASVILGSATPSVESLYNARSGKYAYVALKERYKGVNMPAISIVNSSGVSGGSNKLISQALQLAVQQALQQQKQVILFQNRRGYAPFQICTVCGWVQQCKYCAVSLTYHKSSDKLHCHYCGLKSPVTHACPACGSNRIRSRTAGTEKVEEEIRQLFPQARVARMDVDSMRGKHALSQLLDNLARHKTDILVGTQMVVKGLDFPAVSLVGILSADSLLSYPDFRVNERAFQLMEQVSGRAGRTDGAGQVLIQAHHVSHPVLQWVMNHDVAAFYEHEIQFRAKYGYPPFSRLIKISCRHIEEAKAKAAAAQFAKALHPVTGIAVQGPVPALISRVRNFYHQEVWIKCPPHSATLIIIKELIQKQKEQISGQKGFSRLQVVFDVDPV